MQLGTSASPRHTHEEIVGVRVGPANLEELHQVVELAVDVAADGDGAFLGALVYHDESTSRWRPGSRGQTYDGLHVRLFLEHLTCLQHDGVSA